MKLNVYNTTYLAKTTVQTHGHTYQGNFMPCNNFYAINCMQMLHTAMVNLIIRPGHMR